MLKVGLTGGIATGKSYVRAGFEALGIPTIDADVLAREVVAVGTAGLAAIVARFGDGVLLPDGALDRKALAAIVFNDANAREALESIVHPAVRAAVARWIERFERLPDAERPPYAICDIPLLFETGRERQFDAIVVTACSPEEQVRRVMSRDRATKAEALARLAAQWPIAEKVKRADFVVRTDGAFAETDSQIVAVHRELLRRADAN